MSQNETNQNETNQNETGKVSINPKKDSYVEQRSPSGTKSFSNGDDVAECLKGLNADKIYQVADKLFPDNDFREKYKARNIGMQRMIVGNLIRGWVNKADKQTIADGKEPNSVAALTKITAPLRKEAEKSAAIAQREKDAAKQAAGAEKAKKKAEKEPKKAA